MASMFSRINAIISLVAGLSVSEQMLAFQGYKSRGHGRGKYSGKKKGNICTPWKEFGHMNSPRECERRVRQMKAREAKWAKQLSSVQAEAVEA